MPSAKIMLIYINNLFGFLHKMSEQPLSTNMYKIMACVTVPALHLITQQVQRGNIFSNIYQTSLLSDWNYQRQPCSRLSAFGQNMAREVIPLWRAMYYVCNHAVKVKRI